MEVFQVQRRLDLNFSLRLLASSYVGLSRHLKPQQLSLRFFLTHKKIEAKRQGGGRNSVKDAFELGKFLIQIQFNFSE